MARERPRPFGRHVPDVRPEYILLGFLESESMHGYDLYRRCQERLGLVWRMSQSQMYSILKRLEAQGLVARSAGERAAEPSRRYLAATDEGRRRFEAWLLQPTDCSSRLLRLEFVSRLYFASSRGGGLLDRIAREQEAAIERELRNHELLYGRLADTDVFNRISVDYRVRQLRAAAEWLRGAVLPIAGAREA